MTVWLRDNAVAIIIAICSGFGSYTAVVVSVANYKQTIVQNSEDIKVIKDQYRDLDLRERDMRLQISIMKASQSSSSESVVKLASTQEKLYESVNNLNQAIVKLSAKMEYIKQ